MGGGSWPAQRLQSERSMTAGPAPDPLALFHDLYERASAQEDGDPAAVALATVDASGAPSVRIVLLKGVDERGFTFFTNYASRKASELRRDPRAALCFHWPSIAVQVRVEGVTERVTAEESDAYFATRPRESQLSAWASRQSEALASRAVLISRYHEADRRLPGRVPRPPFWGGYRLVPTRVEFWRGEEHRLHDRSFYERTGAAWTVRLLYP